MVPSQIHNLLSHNGNSQEVFFVVVVVVVVVAISWATPAAYGGSQARCQIGAVTTGLRHSHSNTRSELCLRPTPQLTAMLDP